MLQCLLGIITCACMPSLLLSMDQDELQSIQSQPHAFVHDLQAHSTINVSDLLQKQQLQALEEAAPQRRKERILAYEQLYRTLKLVLDLDTAPMTEREKAVHIAQKLGLSDIDKNRFVNSVEALTKDATHELADHLKE